jgi:hypothetical protein
MNTYYYLAVVPTVPPEKMEEAGHHAEETLKGYMPTFAKRWEEEWLHELKGYHDTWNKFNFAGASTQELIDHNEWSLRRYKRLWDIHFEIAAPFLVAPSMFHDLYEDVLGESDALHSYNLLQGIDNTSLVAGRPLWALSQKAKGSSRSGDADPRDGLRRCDGRARAIRRPGGRLFRRSMHSWRATASAQIRSSKWPTPAGWKSQKRRSNCSRTT